MVRTEQESDRRRREEKWQTCWCCQDQQRACRMSQASAEKLKHTGPAEKKRVASMPQRESSWQVRQGRVWQKEKEQSRQSKAPDHEGKESQGERKPHLGEREREIRERAWRGEGGLHSEEKQRGSKKEREGKQEEPP